MESNKRSKNCKWYIYIMIYHDKKAGQSNSHHYIGITRNIKKRMQRHSQGEIKTTKYYNEHYTLKEVRYTPVINNSEEVIEGSIAREAEKKIKNLSRTRINEITKVRATA